MVLYLKPQNTLHTNLVFSDEFNEGKLDLSSWSYELGNGCPNLCGWGNNELQVYTKKMYLQLIIILLFWQPTRVTTTIPAVF